MSNPNALLLLADHIKLSLLEQQRAKTLKLRRDSQDGHISRSLDQFREGLESLEKEHQRLQEAGDESKASTLSDTLASLRKQYTDLSSQFQGHASPSTTSTLTHPNDPSLASDFAHAQSSHAEPSSPPPPPPPQKDTPPPVPPTKKAVRFSSPSTDLESQQKQRRNLFPYRDDPDSSSDPDSAGYADHIASAQLSNTQIHAYHQQILQDQDAQLDALGASIARQRELSMQIGDELDSQVLLLDESERAADRQMNALGRARRQVGRVARRTAGSGEGRQLGAIVVLIIVLVLLIAILK
ncbi:hypothetical protein N657DRAFT_583184 [Parathielavia appendiculata]|uniref:t-SNARE coiled-coil homology domain-containing protein n=1 Tax=Parathielavia appendiculata TaxID=2587402 RepID=A0AAN6TQA6_9PEZI|nr:hypothetical protein N657DRAFT_583184 [Parathielavia appendiculata]